MRLRGDSRCRSCGAAIAWVATDRRKMPLDPEPHPEGNVVVLTSETARVLTRAELERRLAMPGGPGPLYRSHFTTCPQSDEWRRRGG